MPSFNIHLDKTASMRIIDLMLDQHEYRPPEGTKLGKAKALETVVLDDGVRVFKKSKVRYWVERRGAREDVFILYNDRSYHLSTLGFIRRFKVIIKGAQVRMEVEGENEGAKTIYW